MIRLVASPCELCTEALCRTRTGDPFLTIYARVRVDAGRITATAVVRSRLSG
jgi:hypothetical protein